MKTKLCLMLTMISIILIAAGCSGGGQPEACPDMALITDMKTPDTALTMDNVVGSNAPDFTWQVIDCKSLEPVNKSTSLSDLKGGPLLLVFTYAEGSGCKECAVQVPYIEAAYDKLGKELTVLNVYTDTNAGVVRDYLAKKGYLTFPALIDIEKKIRLQYCLTMGFPVNVLINSQGIIKQYKVGRFKDQAEVESWLDSL